MHNWQRTFAYTSGAVVFGLLIIIISHSYIQYVAQPGTTGYLFLIGFGLIYLNINFGISRRFLVKAVRVDWICYAMALITIIPTLFWVWTKDVGLGSQQLLFMVVTVFSALLGSYFGIRRGKVKREKYIRQLREEERDLPDSLKRPHDTLSRN